MKNEQKELVKILSAAIRGRKIENIGNCKFDLVKIFDEATHHNVSELIYYNLKNEPELIKVYKEILEDYKKKTILSAINQAQHINEISKVLSKFNENKIPVIILKGLVVRYYYPNPDLRTMSDADVLVHPEDMDRVRNMLTSIGYKEYEDSHEHGAHIIFYRGKTVIEVHWRLTNEEYYNGDTSFEKYLWENTMKVQVGGVDTLSVGLEDLALHLCVHMAVHLAVHGFGIRQLCDLVLLVENKGDLIDWNSFLDKSKNAGVEKFSLVIFTICNKLFNMDIPKEIQAVTKLENKYVELFIEDIFNNGVGGRRDSSEIFAKEIAFDLKDDANKGSNIFYKFMRLLFPPIDSMNDKYNYAKEYKVLAPIAWIHHLFQGVSNKEYSLINKIKIVTCTLTVARKRNKLMNWLEI